ncbi:MAG: AMP-binding protein [Arcobacter sp.]|nr:AMP-binding protein [Arcobacter sp.]
MKSALNILYSLKNKGVQLWFNTVENLKFKHINEEKISELDKILINKNSEDITKILSYNDINSFNKSLKTKLFMNPCNNQPLKLSGLQSWIYNQSLKNNSRFYLFLTLKIKECNETKLIKVLTSIYNEYKILNVNVYENSLIVNSDLKELPLNNIKLKKEEFLEFYTKKINENCNVNNNRFTEITFVRFDNNPMDIILLIKLHSLIVDFYSVNLIRNEIIKRYNNDKNINFTKTLNYFDITEYQKYLSQSVEFQKAIKKLSNNLKNAEILRLKGSRLPDNIQKTKSLEVSITNEIREKLNNISLNEQVNIQSIFLCCLHHVLSVYSGSIQNFPICIGISSRPDNCKKIIGPLTNFLPVVGCYDKKKSLIENIKKFNQELNNLSAFSSLSLNDLTEYLIGIEKNIINQIQIFFQYYNNIQEVDESSIFGGLQIFGIAIKAIEYDQKTKFTINYSSEYNSFYIKNIVNCFKFLLENIESFKNKKAEIINLLSNLEYNKIVKDYNREDNIDNDVSNINKVFEEQVNKVGQKKIAVICEDKKLTYKELNERSNQLANYLIKNGVIGGDLVAISMDRSIDIIISILAVLKTGAGYVPIDPLYPDERIKYIIEDSKSQLLLTKSYFIKKFEKLFYIRDCKIVAID